MKQDYFVYDGVTYQCGTQVRLMRYPYKNPVFSDLAYFVYYDTEYDTVWCRMCYTGNNYGYSMKEFLKMFGGATDVFEPCIRPPEVKRLKDSQIPGLMVGWAWYIVIMLFLAITTFAVPGCIITSIIFDCWRKKVIEEDGYYVER